MRLIQNDPVTPSERNAPAFAFNASCLERLVPTDAKLVIFPVQMEWKVKKKMSGRQTHHLTEVALGTRQPLTGRRCVPCAAHVSLDKANGSHLMAS
jgi:hypothetical protein